jgi:hypothetical protein
MKTRTRIYTETLLYTTRWYSNKPKSNEKSENNDENAVHNSSFSNNT